jgi:MoaA/NifB/PqqE/SkfB family radical SAM enzyme
LEILSACIEDAVALGYRQLAVSGGEPLLYKPLAGLLSCARRLGMLNTITSNGMLMTPHRWEPLAPLVDFAAISIDGTEPEHDRIRREEGAFARTVQNLSVIRASGVPFGIIFTLTQHNVDNLEFVVRLALEQGAKSVQVHPLTMHGRAATTMQGARPDAIELLAALVEAARLGRELGISVHVDALTLPQLRAHRRHLVPAQPVRNLVDVAPVLVVEANGSVMPMTHELSRVLKLGSLADASLSSLADQWLATGHGDLLADACARTWEELSGASGIDVVYWYEEVAARTNQSIIRFPRDGGMAADPMSALRSE